MQTSIFSKVLGDRSFEDACEIAAEIGYDGIEPRGRPPHLPAETTDAEARRYRELLDDLGLDVPCLATYSGHYVGKDPAECEGELSTLERFCELAELLGTDLIRHGPGGPAPFEATEEDYEFGARWMRRAADLAGEYDKRIAIEIHADTILESASQAVDFLERVDRDNLGVIHDAGNMFIAGEAYGPESIETLGDRLFHVHVKDERMVDGPDGSSHFEHDRADGPRYFAPTLLGEGEVDHGPLFEALADAGYDGFLTAECHLPQAEEGDDARIAEHEYEAMTQASGSP
jgi:sugar phosphate isomerase/epimerase